MSNTEDVSQSLHDYLFRSTSDGVLVMGKQGVLTHINPAASAMLGITPEDCLGKKPSQIFRKHPALLNLLERSGEQQLEVRLPRRRIAQGIADNLNTGERVVVLQDVTERRDLDNRREMLSRAIAHDLRNPISAIGGFADLVTRFGELNDQQQKFIKRIKQTSSKLHEMIVTLVDLAWIEAGMPLNHVPIRLNDAIQKAISDLESTAQEHQIGMATSIQRPLPIITGDPERLHQAIYQILYNAILYSHAEGNIVIHAWGDEHEVYCSIADQGIGISDGELELIFDRMYRSRDLRVENIPGGGVGLTIARTIIKRHGGDIWASSNLDDGSTFTFMLPAVQP
jgi:two-component system phosphate regulon sensor histidine kinase PhoR